MFVVHLKVHHWAICIIILGVFYDAYKSIALLLIDSFFTYSHISVTKHQDEELLLFHSLSLITDTSLPYNPYIHNSMHWLNSLKY